MKPAVLSTLFILIFGAVLQPLHARRTSKNYYKVKNIKYGESSTKNGSKDLLLDLYLSEQDCTEPRPTLVLIHGGSFRSGSKSDRRLVDLIRQVFKNGYNYNIASINYRLIANRPILENPRIKEYYEQLIQAAGKNKPREYMRPLAAATEDTLKALEWLSQSGNETYCIDPERLALYGSSAGGAIVYSVAYGIDNFVSSDQFELQAVASNAGFSYYDLPFVDEDDPPAFILHGALDSKVSYGNSQALSKRLDEVGVPHSLYKDKDGKHLVRLNEASKKIVPIMLSFIDEHMHDDGEPIYEKVKF